MLGRGARDRPCVLYFGSDRQVAQRAAFRIMNSRVLCRRGSHDIGPTKLLKEQELRQLRHLHHAALVSFRVHC